jgi:hypothetical protein
MEKMIAYCGLVCTECPAYVATQSGEAEALQRVAEMWSQQFNETITADDCLCDGCLATTRLGSYCRVCEIRACGVQRAVMNCAYCDDYGCEKLAKFWAAAPEAKSTLEGVRAGL